MGSAGRATHGPCPSLQELLTIKLALPRTVRPVSSTQLCPNSSPEGIFRGERGRGIGMRVRLGRGGGGGRRSSKIILGLIYSLYIILQYNMWNTGFPFGSFVFFFHPPCAPYLPVSLPELPQSRPLLPKENQTIDQLQQGPTLAPLARGRGQQAAQAESAGRRRRLTPRQKLRRKRLREDNFERKKQKKDRNIPSNIIKNLFNFLSRHPSLPQFLKSSAASSSSAAVEGLALKLKRVISQQRSYVSPRVLQALWNSASLSVEEGVVFRVMVRRFLVVIEPLILAQRGSFRRGQKLEYLRCCRQLWKHLQENYYS